MTIQDFFDSIYDSNVRYKYTIYDIPVPCPDRLQYSCSIVMYSVNKIEPPLVLEVDNLSKYEDVLDKIHLVPTWGYTTKYMTN